MWRHLTVGGLDDQDTRLALGMKWLKSKREDDGRWQRAPFWYTICALVEIDTRAARTELMHAVAHLEKMAKRRSLTKATDQRRHALAERALARV